jgi:hypothetical protein
MAPVSRLGRQIQEVLRCLDDLGAASALIGGLALAPYRVIRATTDVDLLIDARLADSIDGAIRSLGYECLHRSADAANYVRGDERVDFLFASRPAAMELLAGAVSHQTPFGELRVVSLEGLIEFCTSSSPGDSDPPTPLTAFRAAEPRAAYTRPAVSATEAFTALDDLMAVVESLCASWPAKPAMTRTPDLRL